MNSGSSGRAPRLARRAGTPRRSRSTERRERRSAHEQLGRWRRDAGASSSACHVPQVAVAHPRSGGRRRAASDARPVRRRTCRTARCRGPARGTRAAADRCCWRRGRRSSRRGRAPRRPRPACRRRGAPRAGPAWAQDPSSPPDRRATLGRGPHALGGVLGGADDLAHRLAEADRLDHRQALRRAPPSPSWPGRPAARPGTRRSASARASSISSSWGTTQPASPISLARSASMRSPVSSSSIAALPADQPGRRIAPTIVGTPMAHLGEPELGPLAGDHEVAPGHERQPVAEAVAVHRGDHGLEDLPAALEGVDRRLLPERAGELAGRCRRRRAGRRRRRTPRPAPVTIATHASSSSRKRVNAALRSRRISPLTALRASGRL